MLILPVVNEDFKRKTKSEIGSQESIKTREYKMMIWLQNTVKDFKKQKNRYRVNLYKNNVRKDAIAGFFFKPKNQKTTEQKFSFPNFKEFEKNFENSQIKKLFQMNHLTLQADSMSGNMLIYEADIKKNQNVIRLPISKEIEKLNLEIKKKTRELFFTKNRKFKDESQKEDDMLFITNLKNNQTIPNNGIIKITENFDEEENYKKEEKIQKIVNNRSIIENSKILLLPNKKNLTFLENSYIHTQTNSEMSNLFVPKFKQKKISNLVNVNTYMKDYRPLKNGDLDSIPKYLKDQIVFLHLHPK